MSKDTRHYKVDQKLAEMLKLPVRTAPEFDYVAAGLIDSLSLLSFVLDIEAVFSIELADEEVGHKEFRTFGGLSNLIFRKLS